MVGIDEQEIQFLAAQQLCNLVPGSTLVGVLPKQMEALAVDREGLQDGHLKPGVPASERAAGEIDADDGRVGTRKPAQDQQGAAMTGSDFQDGLRLPLGDDRGKTAEFRWNLNGTDNGVVKRQVDDLVRIRALHRAQLSHERKNVNPLEQPAEAA